MFSFYRSAGRAFAAGLPMFLALAVLMEAFGLSTSDGRRDSGATFVAGALVAYLLHRHLLLGERAWGASKGTQQRPAGMGRFMLVSAALLGVPIVTAFPLVFHLAKQGVPENTIVVAYVFAVMVLYLVMLSLFGTMLPASAVREPFGLGLTLARARRTFLPIFVGLVVGPGLFSVLLLAVATWLHASFGFPLDAYERTGAFDALGFAGGALMRLGGLLSTTLAVAVLCNAYRRVVPPGAPAGGTDEIAVTG